MNYEQAKIDEQSLWTMSKTFIQRVYYVCSLLTALNYESDIYNKIITEQWNTKDADSENQKWVSKI